MGGAGADDLVRDPPASPHYQIALLPPYFVNVGKRLVKAPKVPALGSGLVAQVAGLTTWEGAVTVGRDGSLLEAWVIDDLIASDRLSGLGSRHHYWRTSAGAEVNLVVERPIGIVAVKVKSATTVRRRDVAGLSGRCAQMWVSAGALAFSLTREGSAANWTRESPRFRSRCCWMR